LTVTGAGGSDAETKLAYITVSAPINPSPIPSNGPVVNFTGTPRNGTAPLTVQFTDLSTNNPTSWTWSFGDGNSSNSQNPSHIYMAAGSYTVSLTASNGDGSGNKTVTDYIVVYDPTPIPSGDDGTVTEQTSFNWWWLLLLLFVAIAGVAIYYYGFVKNK
jgi:PKD repeat protein